jgi:hypothetical protein
MKHPPFDFLSTFSSCKRMEHTRMKNVCNGLIKGIQQDEKPQQLAKHQTQKVTISSVYLLLYDAPTVWDNMLLL